MDLKQTIRDLLSNSVLISGAQKSIIIERIDTYKEDQLQNILELLKEAAKKQPFFIK